MSNTQQKQPIGQQSEQKPRKPNENGTVHVQAHMRIYDPKTQKTYVEGRA